MKSVEHKVTCAKCKSSDKITIIDDQYIDWRHSTCNHIVSGRKRLDNQWGFQCVCGNNDILSKQEQRQITDKQKPDPQEIAAIVRNLEQEPSKFIMS